MTAPLRIQVSYFYLLRTLNFDGNHENQNQKRFCGHCTVISAPDCVTRHRIHV